MLESIYSRKIIYSVPIFGYKPDEFRKSFMTRESDGIAMENMLSHLNENALLDIIVPAKITFAAQGYEKLRTYIKQQFNVKNILILPEGTFRPTTAVKTYFFSVANKDIINVEVGNLELVKDRFESKCLKKITKQEFLSHEDWLIELLLSEDDANIQKFKNSNLEKVKYNTLGI